MKDKILEILNSNLSIEFNEKEAEYYIAFKDDAAYEISQMMCDEIFGCINCCVDLKKTISESTMIRVS